MNSRERFVRNLLFKEADGVTFYEIGFYEEVVNQWYREGLPVYVLFRPAGLFAYATGKGRMPVGGGINIYEFFDFDSIECLPIDYYPIPRFVERVLEETSRYRVERDETGMTRKVIKTGYATVPAYSDWPVKTREEWELIKERFDPHDPRRSPSWDSDHAEFYATADFAVGTWMPGIYYMARWFMGDIRLLTNLYRDPSFVHEIMDFWTDFLMETVRKFLKETKVDFVQVTEDMCYNKGLFISPQQFRDFMLPNYRKLASFFRSHGVPIFMVDSDGNANELIPLLIEAGVNVFNPIEVQAGMDVLELRRRFGKRIGLLGGIDKRKLSGDKSAIENELKSKQQAIDEGGYIPMCDHRVTPGTPFENYKFYVSRLREYCHRA